MRKLINRKKLKERSDSCLVMVIKKVLMISSVLTPFCKNLILIVSEPLRMLSLWTEVSSANRLIWKIKIVCLRSTQWAKETMHTGFLLILPSSCWAFRTIFANSRVILRKISPLSFHLSRARHTSHSPSSNYLRKGMKVTLFWSS